ncbi:S1 RNA-binding domain-containing protein [Oscillibacter sp. MSJ-2]|uniref:S1 RNA-binding domain-containing protein n=1 Tax=Dysosmobacter acutus TaxID=2841504 RepID=A0ABS6F5Y4_9FIRM|nr:S1 RNA-binding domain-containing protein [Dysosmobacter acutus]MBU5625711.1 S1 RNA-binding domain-containing protein [Dysosmobacter acutus]
MEPEVGSILEGKVTTITKFGAFVALEGGKSGLIHISEIANSFVNDVHDFLQEGQSVKVKVLSTENGKINLSIKRLQPPAPRPGGGMRPAMPRSAAPRPVHSSPRPEGRSFQQPLAPTADSSFEDKLKQFMSASEGKLSDLNRNMDGKRGGGRRKR